MRFCTTRSSWVSLLALMMGARLAAASPPAPQKQLNGCEQEFLRVVEGVRPSVVTVIAYSKMGEKGPGEAKSLKKTIGSGVIINREGHVLTTTSVVGSSRNLFIRTHDGIERQAVFLGADHETGLALLMVKAEGLSPAPLGSSQGLQPGAWAIIVAESFGHYPRYAFGAFTRMAATTPGLDDPALLEMSTQVYPGNSGGAVANASGEVIGVVLGALSAEGPPAPGRSSTRSNDGTDRVPGGTGSAAPGDTGDRAAAGDPGGAPVGLSLSLAIPIDRAGKVASDLAAHGTSGPGFLGVNVRTSTPALKDLLQFEEGVVILDVLAMSPAEAAGIEAGDVILKFGGQTVHEPSELAHLVAKVRPGERRDVELLRGDVHLTRAVTMGTAPGAGGGDRQAADREREELKLRVEELKRELEALEGRLEPR